MGVTITPGRTWVTGETVTATKLNTFLTSATTDQGAFQTVGAGGTFNASNGDFIFIGENDTVTLMGSPSDNDIVTVAQLDGDLATTNSTISGNGNNFDYNSVNGVSADSSLVLNENFVGNLTFTYSTSAGVYKIT